MELWIYNMLCKLHGMAQDSLEIFSVGFMIELYSLFQAFKLISSSCWGGIFVLECKDVRATRKNIL